MSKTNLKAEALAAYDAATEQGDNANWRSVAELLRACLPVPRVTAIATDTWGDYAIPGNVKLRKAGPVFQFTFADGEVVRGSFATIAGKPLNMGRAIRLASIFYRSRKARSAPVRKVFSRKLDRAQAAVDEFMIGTADANRDWSADRWELERREDELMRAVSAARLECYQKQLEGRDAAYLSIKLPAVTACHVETQGEIIAMFAPDLVNEKMRAAQ